MKMFLIGMFIAFMFRAIWIICTIPAEPIEKAEWHSYYFQGTSGTCYHINDSNTTLKDITELQSCDDTSKAMEVD